MALTKILAYAASESADLDPYLPFYVKVQCAVALISIGLYWFALMIRLATCLDILYKENP
jgi:hypothetical protein